MNDTAYIAEKIAETLIKAGTTFRRDQTEAYRKALKKESSVHSRWVLEQILSSSEIAEIKKLPLCDDTGIPHVVIEIGGNCPLPGGFLRAVEYGIEIGLRELPGRPMAVLGSDEERISQSAGLSDNAGALLPAPFQIIRSYRPGIESDEVRVTVLMHGGGPEIRGKTLRIFHKHSSDVVEGEMISWATESAKLLGCQPCVFSFGIGRSNYEAAALSLQAMAFGEFGVQSPMELRITEAVNKSGIGSLGLGGDITVLATFIRVGEQRASGVRVVSMRAGCCFDPRRADVTFKF
ncbi:MAG: fumarate hydratase [Synergistaceae bacterium]|nr:fumarate hydratase [Synergistaceae bacterium]